MWLATIWFIINDFCFCYFSFCILGVNNSIDRIKVLIIDDFVFACILMTTFSFLSAWHVIIARAKERFKNYWEMFSQNIPKSHSNHFFVRRSSETSCSCCLRWYILVLTQDKVPWMSSICTLNIHRTGFFCNFWEFLEISVKKI